MEFSMRRYLFFSLLSSTLFGLPQGSIPKNGECKFTLSFESLEIIASDRSIIEWSDFSIETGEIVRFIQPNAAASVLNRVMEAYPSRLLGKLEANGQVLLINPNGVMIGRDANVNTGSLIASTLDLQNNLFLAGKEWSFTGSSQEPVVNKGRIEGQNGDVLLIGNRVSNQGAIETNGLAGLIAHSDVLFKPADTDRLYVRGRSFSDVFVHEATHQGSIRAKDAYVLGESVCLSETSKIDVSSDFGGGTVLIGGGYQGKNEQIANAKWTRVEKGAVIDSSARLDGNGGKIILWGDQGNAFYGHLSARGGSLGGDGGLLEISSPNYLAFEGTVDTLAPFGKTGTLLLDPSTIVIDTFGGVSTPAFVPPTYNPAVASAQLAVANLNAALAASSVAISTSAGAGGTGDISINQLVTWGAAGNTLTINADRDVIVTSPGAIVSTGANAAISVTAGRNITITNGSLADNGSITNIDTVIGAPVTVTAQTGNITLTGGSRSTFIGNHKGTVAVRAPVGSITFLGSTFSRMTGIGPGTELASPADISGAVIVEAGNDISLFGGSGFISLSVIGRGVSRGLGALPTTLNADISVTAGHDILLQGSSGAALIGCYNTAGNLPFTGNITVSSGNNLTILGSVAATGGFAFIGGNNTNSGVVQSNILVNVGGNLLITVQNGIASSFAKIGYQGGISTVNSTRVNIAGNLWIDGRIVNSTITRHYTSAATVVGYRPETFVHCLGEVVILGSNGNAFAGQSGLPEPSSPVNPNHTTHLWAGGSIRAVNGNGIGQGAIVRLQGPTSPTRNNSFRAGSDFIQSQSGTFNSAGTGSLAPYDAYNPQFSGYFIEADACYSTGELWPAQTATVNGVNIFAGTPLGSPSPAIGCNGFGGVATDTTQYDLSSLPTPYNGAPLPGPTLVGSWVLNTTLGVPDGNLVIHSAGAYAYNSSVNANLVIANAASMANPMTLGLVTTSGNIEVAGSDGPTLGGCNCFDSFNNVSIVNVANPWTSGSIYVSASNHLDVTTVPVATSGALSPITLIADFDDTGAGNLSITQNIASAGGPILLDAGFGAGAGGTSIINQTAGLISSAGGAITAQAVSNINFSGTSPTSVTTGGGSLTVNSTRGTIIIDENILTLGGAATFIAGFDINVNPIGGTSIAGGNVATVAGNLTMLAGRNITVSGDPLSLSTTSGNINATATSGTITITQDVSTTGGNGDFTAGTNILVLASGSVSTQAGHLNMTARNNIEINGDPTSILTTTGAISITSDSDLNGLGNLDIAKNITSTSGNITLQAGGPTPCSRPFFTASVNHTAAAVSTTRNITVNAEFDINLSSPIVPSITTSTGFFHTQAGRDTNLSNTTISKTGPGGAQDLLMISGRDMNMINSHILAIPAFVTLVVDNCFPASPLIGPGAFNMDAASSIDPVNLRIFTALQNQNSINGLLNLNGNTFNPGTLFENTETEHWCQYFGLPFPYPLSVLGNSPLYTIFYKNCLQLIVEQAEIVVTEALRMFDEFQTPNFPYFGLNEFYGWPSKFIIFYDLNPPDSNYAGWGAEHYFLKRKNDLLVAPRHHREYEN